MTTTPTTIQPISFAKENILGMMLALEQRFGCQPHNDSQTTLNHRFGTFDGRLPATKPIIQYFCWGVGGKLNDTQNNSSAQYVLATNLAPYAIRPFRAVLETQDLSADEMKKYAMRVVKNINGARYCLYYLKRIDFSQSQVQFVYTDPVSNLQAPYAIDYSKLNPVAPVADANGVYTDNADAVQVVLPGSITLTGQEVLESASVIDGGDMRYAVASELGFVSASAEQVQAVDFAGQPFAYTEAIMAQMVDQYTWIGTPFMSTRDTLSRTIGFSARNLITSA